VSAADPVPVREALAPPVRTLLDVLAQPALARGLALAQWDGVVRTARIAHLLGTLAARLDAEGALDACPASVRAHLAGALLETRHLAAMARIEIDAVVRALAPLDVPLLLVKGAGYLAARLPHAAGRMLRDVDVLVPRARIAAVEQALLAAGWRAEGSLDAYDQRYYRRWSHQIPPLRRAGQPLELDVHHAILPPTGRLRPDHAALLRDSRPAGAGVRVPDPADQVVHAALHLFQDSDCTSRLRELVDVDALVRLHAAREPSFAMQLAARARLHGAERPVGYALAFAAAWLGTPVDEGALRAWRSGPQRRARAWVVRRAALALPPPDPEDGRDRAARAAARWLQARALWLRMPPSLLAYHGAMKAWRALRGQLARRRAARGP